MSQATNADGGLRERSHFPAVLCVHVDWPIGAFDPRSGGLGIGRRMCQSGIGSGWPGHD